MCIRDSFWSFVFSILIRIGSLETIFTFFNFDLIGTVGGAEILERTDVWNTGIEIIIAGVIGFILFMIPRFRSPLKKVLNIFFTVILVSFITPIIGSLISYIMVRRVK